jgi:hypothetical protein
MKALVVGLLIASFSFQGYAKAKPANTTIDGKAVIANLALTCGDTSWASFAKSDAYKFLSTNSIPTFENLKISENEILDPESGAKLSFKNNQFNFFIGSKSYTGSDVCDLYTQINDSGKKHSLLKIVLFSEAFAKDLVNENKTNEILGMAVSGAGIVYCTAQTFTLGTGICMGALLGTFVMAQTSLEVKTNYEDLLNHPFKLSCTDKLVTIENDRLRLVADKDPNKPKAYMLDVKKGDLVSSRQMSNSKGQQFAIELAKKCNNSDDAQKLSAEIESQRKDAAQKIATAAAQKPMAPFGAPKDGGK